MAPLPLSAPDGTGALNNLLSTLSSLFKFRTSQPTLSPSARKEAETLELTRLNISSSGPPTASQLPSTFTLRPPGPQKEAWWKSPDLSSTDGGEELMLNPWKDNRRRSLPDQEPVAVTMNGTSIDTPVKQEPNDGRLIFVMIFAYVATILTGAVLLQALATIEDKLLANLKRSWEGLEEEAGMGKALRRVMYTSTVLALVITLGFGSFALWELFSWGRLVN